MTPPRVAVIGGGIAGLAAAWSLVEAGADVTVFDPGPLGGKLRTTDFCGLAIDEGADAFIARVPHAVELCRSLGLGDELVAPSADRAMLWAGGRLRPLPDGLVLGVPTRLRPLVGSGLVSPPGVLRAGLDLVLPAARWRGDLSVAALVSRRLGGEVARRLVDPLVGGIHAGRTEELSAEAAAPQLAGAARSSRSLMRGLRPSAAAEGGDPLFLAVRGGMGRLVERLVAALGGRGVTFEAHGVSQVGRAGGGEVLVTAPGARASAGSAGAAAFDAAVVAVAAPAAAELVAAASPPAAARLREIEAASVVVVTMAYPQAALTGLARWPGYSGFLVPRREGRLMTACSVGSAKWPQWSIPDHAILRVSAGRAGDDRAMALDDPDLVARLSDEVTDSLGATAPPTAVRISRWPDGFPQYRVGHFDRVAAIEAGLAADLPGVALAGSSYRGVGIPACIASGAAAASAAMAHARRSERPEARPEPRGTGRGNG